MKQVGIIYSIVCKDNSIHNSFLCSRREKTPEGEEARHKYNCDNGHLFNCDKTYNWYSNHNNVMYKFIRRNGGWKNWKFTIIEEFYCDEEMRKKEHFYFNKNM